MKSRKRHYADTRSALTNNHPENYLKRRTWRPPNDLPYLHAPLHRAYPLRVLDVRERIAHAGKPGVRKIHNKEIKERKAK